MIKKLRKKFILTNMLLVSLVLVLVFAVLAGSNAKRLAQQSQASISMALKWSDEVPPPRFEISLPPEGHPPRGEGQKHISMVPVFVVTLDGEGNVSSVNGGNTVEVSDEIVTQAVKAAREDSGVIRALSLRYQRETDREGVTRIAFADLSWETSSLWPLILSSLLVGIGALGVFFLISLFLSTLALRPAAEAWEQQRRFVADASHELKTPLTVILTNTGILLSHTGDTIHAQKKWVEYIRDEAQRMQTLVEDLLFLAKHDAGRGSTPPAPVELSELIWGCLLPFEPVAFEAGVTLESEITPGLTVIGQADQLRRLTTILLDNGVKYAGAGGHTTLCLARERRESITLTVCNTGDAIPPEHLDHLFERFYRSDNSRARSSGGYGLGLSIAKSIVDDHGGTISVTSTAQAGTIFTVKLPACP